jgi:hypothetical protein
MHTSLFRYGRLNRSFVVLTFALLGGVMPLSGCGSGSGARQGVAPVATRMRTLKYGDHWIYRLTQVTDPPLDPIAGIDLNGNTEWFPSPYSNLTGTTSIFVSAETQNDVTEPKLTFQSTFDKGRGGFAVSSLFHQDTTNGAVYTLARNELGRLREPVETLPGVWGSGINFERTLTGSDDRTARIRFAILGKETVEVAAGRFETWKTSITYELPPPSLAHEMTRVENLYWFAPQLGHFVQARIVSTRKDQRTVTEELRLIQSNTLKP